MPSTKSRPNALRSAMQPQRRNGRLRVAAILKAAAAVIAEKGYEAATMAEIAARSDTRIGSLYRFFPNKGILVNALIAHYHQNVDDAFGALEARAPSLSLSALADALLDVMVCLHKEAAATIRKLLEAPESLPLKRGELRTSIHRHIARVLRLRCNRLTGNEAQDIAVVVLHTMKTMAAFCDAADTSVRPGAIRELREMTRLYLKNRLK